MNLVELTEFIIKSIVDNSNEVAVKEFSSADEDTITIEVLVKESDFGKVIGKNGKNINAIRTLVQASSSLKDNKYVEINVDKF